MHHEVLVAAPLRIDFDQLRTNVDHPHARRHHGSGAERKVDAVHARHVAAGENGLLDARALLRREVHVAGLASRGATRLRLALSLTLLWSWALTLLRRRLALLTRSLPGGVISLALATILGLTLLALVTLTPLVLRLAFLALLHLVLLALLHLVLPARALARGLVLAVASAGLLRRTLAFALVLRLGFTLTLLRLARRRLALGLAVL